MPIKDSEKNNSIDQTIISFLLESCGSLHCIIIKSTVKDAKLFSKPTSVMAHLVNGNAASPDHRHDEEIPTVIGDALFSAALAQLMLKVCFL